MTSMRDEVQDRLRLNRLDHFPPVLLETPAGDLWRTLPGPTLFHIPGRQSPPLFVTVLLHGNEDTGWQAVQQVMKEAQGRGLARDLLLFVGNIDAARANVRTLPSQTDYNRVWPGSPLTSTPEARLMSDVSDIVRAVGPFASIDIHNNTGHNPHYGCVNVLDERYLHLARLFSRTVVYFTRPLGVQSAALARICPSVTVECGRVGGMAGTDHAAGFIRAALAMSHFPSHPVPEHDLDLLQTFAIVKVPANASLSFDNSDADFRFRFDLDQLNFSELEPRTSFGRLGGACTQRLEVVPGADAHSVGEYFDYAGGDIRLSRPAIPSMLTLDANAIRLDSLGYLMHRIGRDGKML